MNSRAGKSQGRVAGNGVCSYPRDLELTKERNTASVTNIGGILGDQSVNILTLLPINKAKDLQCLLHTIFSLLVKLHSELTASDFQQTHIPCAYRCLAISKPIVPLQQQRRAVAPHSPKCQWVTVHSGESWSWSSPAADTAMQLQCRAPGRGTLIQWYSCCPLSRGHIAGLALPVCTQRGWAGPGIGV